MTAHLCITARPMRDHPAVSPAIQMPSLRVQILPDWLIGAVLALIRIRLVTGVLIRNKWQEAAE